MERCNACGAMAIWVARQETVGETSTVHFSGECGRCSEKLKWHRKIVADVSERLRFLLTPVSKAPPWAGVGIRIRSFGHRSKFKWTTSREPERS